MAYTPTNWECGDVVTAEALNKIEQGIAEAGGNSLFIVNYDYTNIDKTFAEITQAVNDGKTVIANVAYGQAVFFLKLVSADSIDVRFSAVVPNLTANTISSAVLYALEIDSSDNVYISTRNISLL